MSTPAGDADAPATLEERVNAALDTCDDMLTLLPRIVERLERLEQTAPAGGAKERRSDFRFEAYPAAETDEEQQEQTERARRAWARLQRWVHWLVATYRLASIVPPCWPAHPAVREELISLRLSWVEAWADGAGADAPLAWLERLERSRSRLGDGNWGVPRCDGTHDPSGIDLAGIYQVWAKDPRAERAQQAIAERPLVTVDVAGGEAR